MRTAALPADLEEEILSRVPAMSLKRLRSTCKRWNTLFNDRRFTNKHLRKAPKQPHVLMLKEYRIFPMRVNLNVVPPSIEFEDALDLNDNSEQVYIDKVFHCDGLLLCTTKEDELVVWNPCSRVTRWIKQNDGSRFFHRKEVGEKKPKFALGYENNISCRSYKILMFWDRYQTVDNQVDGFEIYDFNSNAWRVVNVPNCFVMDSHGVNLKVNAYWNAYDDDIDYLLGFDFTRERFRRLCFPLSTSWDFIYTALSVVREELSVLHFCIVSSKIEIWVTNKMDTNCEADLSWSISFAVDYGFDVYTSLLIDERKKVVLCCDSYIAKVVCTIGEEKEYYAEMPFIGMASQYEHIFNHVPTLVQIQQDIELDDVTTS